MIYYIVGDYELITNYPDNMNYVGISCCHVLQIIGKSINLETVPFYKNVKKSITLHNTYFEPQTLFSSSMLIDNGNLTLVDVPSDLRQFSSLLYLYRSRLVPKIINGGIAGN